MAYMFLLMTCQQVYNSTIAFNSQIFDKSSSNILILLRFKYDKVKRHFFFNNQKVESKKGIK